MLPFWQKEAPAKLKTAEGVVLPMVMVMELVPGHAPVVVYVSVYMPNKLAPKSITPVDAVIDKPAGIDVNVPPAIPVIDGVSLGPDWQ